MIKGWKKYDEYDDTISVLIVVGLYMALFLSLYGIRYLFVEKHPTTSIHPRAAGFNPRTMELFRSAQVEKAIRKASFNISSDKSGILVIGKPNRQRDRNSIPKTPMTTPMIG